MAAKSVIPKGSNWRHGYYGTPTYISWAQMIQRCTNPKAVSFPRYGAVGTTVCDRWRGEQGFVHFLADMGERPEGTSIERRQNSLGYLPENCYWGTDEEQRRNRSDNHWITFQGETLCLQDWAKRVGMRHGAILRRLQRGWTTEAALTRPLRITKATHK